MNLQDAAAIPWMCSFKRDARPSRVVWKQNSDVCHSYFYYLHVSLPVKNSLVIVSHFSKQEFVIEECEVKELDIFVDDLMCNLDLPIRVIFKGAVVFDSIVPRSRAVLQDSLEARGDPSMMFEGKIQLKNLF